MRKLLLIVLALSSAFACTDVSTFYQKYVTVTTFEYPNVDYANVFGSDSVYFDTNNGLGISWENDFAFYHKVKDGSFLGGFCLSYMKSAGDSESVKPEGYKMSPYRSAGPVLSNVNKTYAVFHQTPEMPDKDVEFLLPTYGVCKPAYCWVNNSETVFDALSKKAGATLKIKATGYLKKEITGTAEFNLAADTTVYNWTRFNLSALGNIDEIDFELVASDPSIPLYFCLDELSAEITVEY